MSLSDDGLTPPTCEKCLHRMEPAGEDNSKREVPILWTRFWTT